MTSPSGWAAKARAVGREKMVSRPNRALAPWPSRAPYTPARPASVETSSGGTGTSSAMSPNWKVPLLLKPSSSGSAIVPRVRHEPSAGRALMNTRLRSRTRCHTRTSTVAGTARPGSGTSRSMSP